ncbi:hypothetical protein CCACVL1_20579 [Corchorus capsularis]|uniref:Uncharacterized protein n=1 Tax=Corchorus capsularis TaxID=210143 RepID=A0A1R3HAM6_COCAP|nr:hypothetical protein CCACVL1_20579 [Corchorus capsularis]
MDFYDVSKGSWVLSPVASSSMNKTPQNPEYSKSFDIPLSFNSRSSTDNMPPFSPLSHSQTFPQPSATGKSRKSQWGFWKAMKQYLTCYNPVRSKTKNKQKSRSKGKSAAAAKTSSVHSASPSHAYSAMNAEERDENLKAVITYCNKSTKEG